MAVIARTWIVDRAVLPHTVLAGARVASVDGRIVAVDQMAAGADAERLRGTLLPGLIDLQVNGAGGRSVEEASAEALDTVAETVRAGGAAAVSRSIASPRGRRICISPATVPRFLRDSGSFVS